MPYIKVFLIVVIIHQHTVEGADTASFPVGGLFNKLTQSSSVRTFETLVDRSEATAYYGRSHDSTVVDSYSTSLELCSFTSDNRGIAALIDARPSEGICDISCLLCNRFNISHLYVGWEIQETLAEDLYTFAYHPPFDVISKAFATLIKTLNWDKFTILYEDDNSFIRLQEVINTWPSKMKPILFRKLDPENDNREIFKHIFKVARISYHILDCEVGNIIKYMNEIVKVENSTEYQSFILTNLDAYTVDLGEVPELLANVSTLHLTKPNDVTWKDIGVGTPNGTIRLETALVADALSHIGKAISYLTNTTNTRRITDPPALCALSSEDDYEELAWSTGADLRDALINTSVKGFTGNIEFDTEGRRINLILHYSKLNNASQFIYAGRWESKTNLFQMTDLVFERSSASKSNSKLRIVTKVNAPYFYTVNRDNDTTEVKGYAIDLSKYIFDRIKEADKIEYQYEFYVATGQGYGNKIEGTEKWTGIMGDLIEHKADLAISDITITSERNAVVDFSTPFMSLGISMLFKEPDPVEPDRFSFINPLAPDVWLYLATTYIIVSFVLLICARMSQGDWVNPHPCNQNPENLQNIWSLYNCMWLTMGAIMTQGCDILPRAAGSRWVTGMWWFFALIITASYTANMSTFLSNSRRNNEINDVKALSEQTKVSYGAVLNASTYTFFQNSNDSVYQKIWSVMSSAKPTVFTLNNEEGKDRVQRSKGKYAFFMESTAIEYYTQRSCDLKMVGPKLDSKDYGIAMPKNSPWKGQIDNAILYLQESGELDNLKKKWWEIEDVVIDPECPEGESEEDDDGSLQMNNTSGIFIVLGFGGILGLIVAVIDFLLHARQISVQEKVTFREALESEWRASLDPRQLHKAAAPPRSAPPSTASNSPRRERSQSRAVSVLRAASSFINFDEIY